MMAPTTDVQRRATVTIFAAEKLQFDRDLLTKLCPHYLVPFVESFPVFISGNTTKSGYDDGRQIYRRC
jgi:hypothetical protein